MGSPKQWYEYFGDNFYLPPPEKKRNEVLEDFYVITFKIIDAKNLKTADFYRLNIYFFDNNYKNFFGKNLLTKINKCDGKVINLSDEIFFHGSIYSEDIYFVVELLEIQPRTPTTPFCFGWSAFNLKHHTTALIDYSIPKNVPRKYITLPLFKGCGQILRFLSKPFDAISPPSNLLLIDGYIQFSIETHKAMENCLELVPEFYPISSFESIPGILKIEKGIKSKFLIGYLDNIVINYNGQEKVIEENFINLLNRERAYKNNMAYEENNFDGMQIFERRLKIGIHNGLCYIDDPTIVHMSGKEQYNSTLWKSRSLSRVDNSSVFDYDLNSFVIPNGVRLYKLFNDPRLAIVFSIEYVVGIKGLQGNIHESRVLKFCWGVWCPFGDGSMGEANTVSIPLIGGPRENPDYLLCYKNLLKIRQNETFFQLDSTPKITLKCNFSLLSTQDDAKIVSARQIKTKNNTNIIDDHVDSPKPIIKPRKSLEDKKSSTPTNTISSTNNNLELMESLNLDRKEEEELNKQYLASYSINTNRSLSSNEEVKIQKPIVTNFTRNVFSTFSNADFTMIYDYMGDKPTVVDILDNKIINIPLEMHDKLCINEIMIQFLGINFVRNNFYDPPEKKHYFFTFQFYRFTMSTTEKLYADIQPYTKFDDPIIFKRLDENNAILSNQENGYSLKFTIDQSTFLQGKPDDFIKYLANSELSIDVWDGDSLVHLGTAVIPLKNLCRQGQTAVQTFIQAAVIQNGLPQKDITTSVIYLSISNIGRPSINVSLPILKENHAIECKQLSFLDMDNQIFCKVRAKRLPGINPCTLQQSFDTKNKVIEQKELDYKEKLSKFIEKKSIETTFSEPIVSRISKKKIVYEEEIENYKHVRNESKAGILLKAVFASITTEHTLYVSEGEVGFLEFLLQNSYPNNVECLIDISDSCLQIVTNPIEWKTFKKIHNYIGSVEKNMFHRDTNGEWRIYLKPSENVKIPFKYEEVLDGNENSYAKVIKVVFHRCDNNQPISILELTVISAPTYITRTFRFFASNDETFNQILKLRGSQQSTYESIKISDPEVICVLKQPQYIPGHQEVTIKVQPNSNKLHYINSFVIYFYNDSYYSKLEKCWRIYIHFLPKISSQIIYGQIGKIELFYTENISNQEQIVKLYSSSKHLHPTIEGLFPLENINHSSIIINTLPTTTSNRAIFISLVDPYVCRLKGMWLIDINVKEPNIVKAYRVTIMQTKREISTRSISVSNPYGIKKTFHIKSSNEKLVQLPKEVFQILPHSSTTVDINFLPVEVYHTTNCDVFLFVENAENGRQEETYLLKITYKLD
ncbi:Nephrocystin-4 [Strongyloides ratti]|uniref:Nephrocystin-4 n=1 Tax=Strongyloides ratti TaxID=34506 RepID=A0A090LGJ7_STRRB|nr:Nephrocystin-4 [Strongyloides ratti]CEF68902.1 Nephrocystin-4 [Strongyloides ratti]